MPVCGWVVTLPPPTEGQSAGAAERGSQAARERLLRDPRITVGAAAGWKLPVVTEHTTPAEVYEMPQLLSALVGGGHVALAFADLSDVDSVDEETLRRRRPFCPIPPSSSGETLS